jgi:hypothetical protein
MAACLRRHRHERRVRGGAGELQTVESPLTLEDDNAFRLADLADASRGWRQPNFISTPYYTPSILFFIFDHLSYSKHLFKYVIL